MKSVSMVKHVKFQHLSPPLLLSLFPSSPSFSLQGDDLPDSARVAANNQVPYFMFNVYEPTEHMLLEMRKEERKKTRVTLENFDWTKGSG